MAFNAQWELARLAREVNEPLPRLMRQFKLDLAEMIANCPVFSLGVGPSGNYFVLRNALGHPYEPPGVPGLYSIFSLESVVYFGEASDLYRRQVKDPDNTADSGKTFNNQGRAILKLILHRGWAEALNLDPIFMQLYPASSKINRRAGRTFQDCYRVSEFSKSIEGAMGLYIQTYLPAMLARARNDGLLDRTQ